MHRHFYGTSKSCIDFIIHPADQIDIIRYISTDNPYNHSTHDAHVNGILPIPKGTTPMTGSGLKQCLPLPNWCKCDVDKYQEITNEKLTTLLNNKYDDTPPFVTINRINDILLKAILQNAAL